MGHVVRIRLKPLDRQVIVITGATSGQGLRTAQKAVSAGTKVILAARDEGALRAICGEIRARGGTVDYVVADVVSKAGVRRIANETIALFGGLDTRVKPVRTNSG